MTTNTSTNTLIQVNTLFTMADSFTPNASRPGGSEGEREIEREIEREREREIESKQQQVGKQQKPDCVDWI